MNQSIIILPSIHGFGSCVLDCLNVKIEQSNNQIVECYSRMKLTLQQLNSLVFFPGVFLS